MGRVEKEREGGGGYRSWEGSQVLFAMLGPIDNRRWLYLHILFPLPRSERGWRMKGGGLLDEKWNACEIIC